MKDLFVPLKTEYWNAFVYGDKRDELRLYGKRWNEKTCVIGRGFVLSKGYGKANRVRTEITAFKKQRGNTFGSTYKASIEKLYGSLDVDIAVISVNKELITNSSR